MNTRLSVILLEDSEPDAVLIIRELERAGFEVSAIRVETEAEFDTVLSSGSDVILADYRLPQYDAYHALKHLQRRQLDIPFIVVSGAVSEEVAVECMKLGAADYLLKDRLVRLGPAVRQALEAKRTRESRERAIQSLRLSEARYRSMTDDVLDNSPIGTLIITPDFRVAWANRAVERFFGLPRHTVAGKEQRWLVQEHLSQAVEDPAQFTKLTLATYDDNTYIEHFECHVLAAAGRKERWLEHTSQPIMTGLYEGGRLEQYTDITERKHAEHHQAQLVAELDRRARTVIQEVLQAVDTSSAQAVSPQELRADLTRRLQGMLRVHDLLADAAHKGADIGELVALTLAAYKPGSESLRLHGEKLRLPPGTAPAVGIALQELVGGSSRNGALSDPDGRVDVTWERQRASGHDLLRLVWTELGGQAVVPDGDAIRSRLNAQIPAQVAVSVQPDRAVCEIKVPIMDPMTEIAPTTESAIQPDQRLPRDVTSTKSAQS